MDTELDKIKSTITISLGTKNRLRELKGSDSYEDFINYLIRLKNQEVPHSPNSIELQEFTRSKENYDYGEFKVLFSYNKYHQSSNFIFDINPESVRENGEKINYEECIRKIAQKTNKDYAATKCLIYFKLFEKTIQKELEPLFKHNGRFEDYFSWEQELRLLNLPKRVFEEDVMAKLREYKQGVSA